MTTRLLTHPLAILSIATIMLFLSSAVSVHAQEECVFGDFESRIIDESICEFLDGYNGNQGNALIGFMQVVINFVTGLIVSIGLISIVIGGYFYMTAGGSSDRISTAKTWIVSALSGIILALVSWLILNTISSQFTNPEVPLPSPTQESQN